MRCSEIIVNADDFGLSQEVNKAISCCFSYGIIDRCSLMVNMPYAEEAIGIARKMKFTDRVGLHINLTEGEPLTEKIKKTEICENGLFKGNIINYVRHNLLTSIEKSAIRLEVEAQVDFYRRSRFELNHCDSHQHIHNEFQLYVIIKDIVSGMKSMRIARNLINKDSCKSRIKMVYKNLLNHDIKKHFHTTDYFGSYQEFLNCYKAKDKSVEIMLHPTIFQEELCDKVRDRCVPIKYYELLNVGKLQ